MPIASLPRRRFIQGALASPLFLPAPFAEVWAQSEGALKLVRLPKLALVIGNGAYKKVPALKNPVNDARAMAEALKGAGFEVALKVDADQDAMLEAFQSHAGALATRKCVGLVYFAGHAVQLAWRNYLLPVEAEASKVDDIAARCVDVQSLLELIGKSSNPMNIVILDACRDNPFSRDFRVAQAGLSQMDAPPATLLAYATAPGNTASDGEGANGLYTSKLLREIQVPEAKIEDVFKRVRLNVRRASNGAQVPWESTSLEEDFYFLPPENLRKLSREEEERLLAAERVAFDKARSLRDPVAYEAYLRGYPSGRFAEIAQYEFDRLLAAQGEKRVEIVPAKGNPHTAGTLRLDTGFRVGDTYTYNHTNRMTGERSERTFSIAQITETEVIYAGRDRITDRLGNTIQMGSGRRYTLRQDVPVEFAVGRKWTTHFEILERGSGTVQMDFKVAAKERITVPAGDFECYRIEGHGVNYVPGKEPIDLFATHWWAPDRVRQRIAGEESRRGTRRGHVTTFNSGRNELVSFKQG